LLPRQPLGARTLRPIANQQQSRWNLLLYPIEDLDDVAQSLYGTKVRQVHQYPLVGAGVLGAMFQQFRSAVVEIAVDEVGNHLDGRLHRKHFQGPPLEILGDGGDAVALIDGKARDGQIRRIGANQRDVGTVQGGDVGQSATRAGVIAAQHLARQHGTYGMGNRVVHVQQVELVNLGDFRHARGQRQIV